MIDPQARKQQEELQEGNIVRLNSGSPSLTVVGFAECGKVVVAWLSGDHIEGMTASTQCFHRA
jgi:uncharacterized protein YodC (DUF2158 family)